MTSYHIEQSILVSVLENEFIGNDKSIKEVDLNPNHFTFPFHRKLASGIKRLKELDEPVNTDYLRMKFLDAKKWSINEDSQLIEIMTHNPIGSIQLFNQYYNTLSKSSSDAKVMMI